MLIKAVCEKLDRSVVLQVEHLESFWTHSMDECRVQGVSGRIYSIDIDTATKLRAWWEANASYL